MWDLKLDSWIMVLIRYYFLILNAVLVLSINVSGDSRNKTSDVCMAETLLFRSCKKICGDTQCDIHSYCGEDKRCLHCANAICKSPPIGCEISCAWRFTGNVAIFSPNYTISFKEIESKPSLRNTTYVIYLGYFKKKSKRQL